MQLADIFAETLSSWGPFFETPRYLGSQDSPDTIHATTLQHQGTLES